MGTPEKIERAQEIASAEVDVPREEVQDIRFRFRLRTMFIVTTLVCLGGAYVSHRMQRAEQRRQFIGRIESDPGYEIKGFGRRQKLPEYDVLDQVLQVKIIRFTEKTIPELQLLPELRGVFLDSPTEEELLSLRALHLKEIFIQGPIETPEDVIDRAAEAMPMVVIHYKRGGVQIHRAQQ